MKSAALTRTVALLGLRGGGKTTLGRLLAKRTGAEFIDLDELVLSRFPERTVSETFNNRGEAAWRGMETAVLRELIESSRPASARPPFVLSLGGGAPMAPEIRRLLADAAAQGEMLLVYLRAEPRSLLARLAHDPGGRPSLTGADPLVEIDAVFADRDPIYRALAPAGTLETSVDSIEIAFERLTDHLARSGVLIA